MAKLDGLYWAVSDVIAAPSIFYALYGSKQSNNVRVYTQHPAASYCLRLDTNVYISTPENQKCLQQICDS